MNKKYETTKKPEVYVMKSKEFILLNMRKEIKLKNPKQTSFGMTTGINVVE